LLRHSVYKAQSTPYITREVVVSLLDAAL